MRTNKLLYALIILVLLCNHVLAQVDDPWIIEQCEMLKDTHELEVELTDVIDPVIENSDENVLPVWFPEESLGCLPVDLLNIPEKNRMVVYGSSKVVILNTLTQEVVYTVLSSDFGNHWPCYYENSNNSRIVYNPNTDEVLIGTDKRDILCINLTDYSEY